MSATVICCLNPRDSEMLLKSLASESDLLFKWKFKSPIITKSWAMKASSSKYADHSVKNVELLNLFFLDQVG